MLRAVLGLLLVPAALPYVAGRTWSGIAGGARYSVSLLPWHSSTPPYTVDFSGGGGSGSTGSWLIGQAPAVHCGSRWHRAANGSLQWAGIRVTTGTDAAWGQ